MRIRVFIFMTTGLSDTRIRDALTAAWQERAQLEGAARRRYAAPDAANTSRRAMFAWVLLTMAQDEPNFFALGSLALLTLPAFVLLTLISVLVRRA